MSIGRAGKICGKMGRVGLPLKESAADCWQGSDVLRQNGKDNAAARSVKSSFQKSPILITADTNLSQKEKQPNTARHPRRADVQHRCQSNSQRRHAPQRRHPRHRRLLHRRAHLSAFARVRRCCFGIRPLALRGSRRRLRSFLGAPSP